MSDKYEIHPHALIFPQMTGAPFMELVASVMKDDQEQPIVLLDGKILDGRNRYLACIEAKKKPWTREATAAEAKDPLGYVIRMNLMRRNLSADDRKDVMEKLRAAGKSYRQIGEAVGVDATTVMRTVANATVETPAKVTGKDGKVRSAKAKPRRKHFDNPPEPDAPTAAGNEIVANLPQSATPLSFIDQKKAEATRLREIVTELHALGKEVRTIADTPVGGLINHVDVFNGIDIAKRAIKKALPFGQCPHCAPTDKKDCGTCHGHRFLPKKDFDRDENLSKAAAINAKVVAK